MSSLWVEALPAHPKSTTQPGRGKTIPAVGGGERLPEAWEILPKNTACLTGLAHLGFFLLQGGKNEIMELCWMHTEVSTINSWKYAGYTVTFQELDNEGLERTTAQGALRGKKS